MKNKILNLSIPEFLQRYSNLNSTFNTTSKDHKFSHRINNFAVVALPESLERQRPEELLNNFEKCLGGTLSTAALQSSSAPDEVRKDTQQFGARICNRLM